MIDALKRHQSETAAFPGASRLCWNGPSGASFEAVARIICISWITRKKNTFAQHG
ncbi:MAG: hypothetical protein ACYDHX_14630 [Methanothrix sp.]